MKQLVIMNKETGHTSLGIKISFFDKYDVDNELDVFDGYSIGFLPSKPDGWLIFSGDDDSEGPWMYCKSEMIEEKTEVVCEL